MDFHKVQTHPQTIMSSDSKLRSFFTAIKSNIAKHSHRVAIGSCSQHHTASGSNVPNHHVAGPEGHPEPPGVAVKESVGITSQFIQPTTSKVC
jgi:hypothetical protein